MSGVYNQRQQGERGGGREREVKSGLEGEEVRKRDTHREMVHLDLWEDRALLRNLYGKSEEERRDCETLSTADISFTRGSLRKFSRRVVVESAKIIRFFPRSRPPRETRRASRRSQIERKANSISPPPPPPPPPPPRIINTRAGLRRSLIFRDVLPLCESN